MRFAIPCLAIPLVCSGLGAQVPATWVPGNVETRSHDYDLVHQRIELRNISWDSTSLNGRVTTTLIARRPALDSVILDAAPGIVVRTSTDASGHALRTTRAGDSLVIHFAKPLRFGDTTRFILDYHDSIENGRGLTFIYADGRPHRPQQLWSMGETTGNSAWFPTYDYPNDKETWELLATVPARFTVVSNGRLVSDVRNADGSHTTHWSQEQPSATYLISMTVAPYARIHDQWRGIPVDYYVYREDSALARPLFGYTPDIIETYTRLTGVRYPWAKYAQVTVADFFGGEEMVSATELVDWLPDRRAYADRPWFWWELIPHELAHQWFGDFETTENWSHLWLNEGFAEFMNGAYWEAKLGRHASDDYYLDEYRQFTAIDAERSMPLVADGSNNIYPKGALVLRMLRRRLGDERFWASIHLFLTRHQFGSAVTEDVREAVLDATGENLAQFWADWMYRPGYPRFSVRAAYDSATHRLSLSVKQTQGDSVGADTSRADAAWPSTPAMYHAPVTILVGTSRGDVRRRAMLDAREQTIVIDSLPGAPTMVVFDEGNTIVKALDFPQPTSWLATELAKDPDLWDRWWAIGELAHRADDATAARALATAATGADYFLTRKHAATALAHLPGAVALAALDSAKRDSSAQVRETAITSLGYIGGENAFPALRAAMGDSSYAVQAAALAALIRGDTAHRAQWIARGLATKSYRDVIQSSTLNLIARLGDASYTATVDSLRGENALAANTLAVLAVRGDSAALSSLVRALGDSRAYVRDWTIRALRRMPADLRDPALRAVAGSLRDAKTRREVDALLNASPPVGAH
ncbi:MAG TPA: M1 family aminopeptidase [Gemmatimonadaceae bacterium]|nr:M1 family aminopeptidase [Gemmatimonadaceae bacterium]